MQRSWKVALSLLASICAVQPAAAHGHRAGVLPQAAPTQMAAVRGKAPELPAAAPVPAARDPQTAARSETDPTTDPPLPQPRPGTADARTDAASSTPAREQFGPAVPARPEKPSLPPRPTVTAEQQRQCLAELRSLGVAFEVQEAVSAPEGCAIANPVLVDNLGKDIALSPEALLDCPMAVAAARFMQTTMEAEAKSDLGTGLAGIEHASAYVCRPRHGQSKLSEHAFGNALDIQAFELEDGREIAVRAGAPGAESRFLDSSRKAACGPFKTVLGPGSDADHALHFHLDLAPRRSGGTFCQ